MLTLCLGRWKARQDAYKLMKPGKEFADRQTDYARGVAARTVVLVRMTVVGAGRAVAANIPKRKTSEESSLKSTRLLNRVWFCGKIWVFLWSNAVGARFWQLLFLPSFWAWLCLSSCTWRWLTMIFKLSVPRCIAENLWLPLIWPWKTFCSLKTSSRDRCTAFAKTCSTKTCRVVKTLSSLKLSSLTGKTTAVIGCQSTCFPTLWSWWYRWLSQL